MNYVEITYQKVVSIVYLMEPLPDILHLNTASQEIEMMIQAVKNMNLSKAFVEVSPFFKEYALYMNDYIFISFAL